MKYFVITSHWDGDRQCCCKYVVGQFYEYMHASLFCSAFNVCTASNAVVVDEFELVNSEER